MLAASTRRLVAHGAPLGQMLRSRTNLPNCITMDVARCAASTTTALSSFRQPIRRQYTTTSELDPIRRLPEHYLREMDPQNFDPETLQRENVAFDTETGKPLLTSTSNRTSFFIQSCRLVGVTYHVDWSDGLQSQYSVQWVKDTLRHWHSVEQSDCRVLWRNLDESDVRASSALCLPFASVIEPSGMSTGLETLYKYGFLLVTDTPVSDGGAGVAALASAFSGGSVKASTTSSLLAHYRAGGKDISLPHATEGPLRTLYGTVWSTTTAGQTDGSSVADSAYGQDGLPLHTDMTYHRDPPGLQIFTMVKPAVRGGQSIIADGFAAAEQLRTMHPTSFDTLATVERTYRCVDKKTGWHLEARGPVIASYNGTVTAIRHNDLDRLPDLPPYGMSDVETSNFYRRLETAHKAWDKVLAMDEFRLTFALNPGETLIVANQRCFHARCSFEAETTSPRAVMGCYVSQDELNSRFRMQGFSVP